MDKLKFMAYYKRKDAGEKAIEEAFSYVATMEGYFAEQGVLLDRVNVDMVKAYVQCLIERGENTTSRFVALARYFHMIDRKDIYIYFTSIFGGVGVIDSIKERTEKYAGKDMREKIFQDVKEPAFGTPTTELPLFTSALMDEIQANLPEAAYRRILAGNNHRMPEEVALKEKAIYQSLGSLDDYLRDRHRRKVETLQLHCDEDKVWFEQIITQEIVDYVKGNQEILSAVRNGDKLYITKFPYAPEAFLSAENDVMKRYYTCHCPFARESILREDQNVHGDWCYCSAGYAKFPFEVILGRELEVEVLESVLAGDMQCRFAVVIDEEDIMV